MRKLPNETLEGEAHKAERKCILSGRHAARDDLIRLALGPDGEVAPDVRARAPGRGAWIGVDRATLEEARSKGRLRSALARAFRTSELVVPADLPDRVAEALRRTALDRIGLEAKAGHVVTGSEKIEVAARRGQAALLIHAADAAEDGKRKLDQALRVGAGDSGARRGVVFPEGRAILSLALGRDNVVHVAIVDRAAAARVSHAVERWRAFIGPEAGLGTAPAEAASAPEANVSEGI